jgi:choice-of-anchor A domain-containing protein
MRLAIAALSVGLFSTSAAFAGSLALGPAANYNVFVMGTHSAQNSDIEGRAAVGGTASYQNYSIATALPNSGTNAVFGSSVQWTNGQVHGSLVYGTTANLTGVTTLGGTATQSSLVDFAAAGTQLQSLSQQYADLASNGTTYVAPWNAITLTGANAGLNVFTLSAAALGVANGFTINAPAGSTVLINVTGASATMQNFGFFLNGVTRDGVLFNFADATSLTASGIGIEGSILAPGAAVTFNNGQMNGQMIAGSLLGTGEFHNHNFSGEVTIIPLPPAVWGGAAAMIMVVGARRLTRRR